MFSGILANQAPPKQTAAATIATLCDRLLHATLLEDRRAAVQGLRSFTREYRESVASGGLRGLIGTLAKDIDDVDTVKVVLETLINLFASDSQNSDTPDDIALWLTDEFTQKQENINLLIDLLDKSDFYERLYALRILVALLKNRPDRARDCIYTAPAGIERLIATLDDGREIIRNEGVQLLIALTEDHVEIQKLVGNLGAFEKTFRIIALEGGLAGGYLVQDCLRLLTNLLAFNVSNQNYFRETSVPELAKLFGDDMTAHGGPSESSMKNIVNLLNLCKVFVTFAGLATERNQSAFWKAKLTRRVIDLAFSPALAPGIRAEALSTIGDMIRGNPIIQEGFAMEQVNALTLPAYAGWEPAANGEEPTAYIIDALLDLALLDSNFSAFNLRMAAVSCIEGYVANNPATLLHFLDRAVMGFASGEDETANIFNALIELDSDSRADPYRTWFSGAIFMTLISDNQEARDVAMKLTSGDVESGEEVVTAIQTFSGNLVAALDHGLDPRISLTFLMTLSVWLYENPLAVNDFLNEGATIESLLRIVNDQSNKDVLLQGMCTFLIGVVYEFSSADSPLSRDALKDRIVARIKKDQYFYKLHKFRQHPTVRDFEVTANLPHGKGLPNVYFTSGFIEFFKDNYSHILRSYPGEPLGHHANGASNTGSMELLRTATTQLEAKEEELIALQDAHTKLKHQLAQEQEDSRRFKDLTVQRIKDVAAREIASARDDAQNIQEQAEAEIAAEREAHRSEMQELTLRTDATLRESRAATDKVMKETSVVISKLESHISQLQKELEVLRDEKAAHISKLQKELGALQDEKAAHVSHLEQQLRALHEEKETHISQLEKSLSALRDEKANLDKQTSGMKGAILKLESQLNDQFDNSKKQQSRHESELEVQRKTSEKKIADIKKESEERLLAATKSADESKKRAEKAEAEVAKVKERAEKEGKEAEESAATTQGELDDLMLVMADLEENVKKYKLRLKKLGEEVTDDEGDEDEDEDE
ncbi:hypothetical protein TWF506_005677 [Arthrobotrys conoides]|uniref:Intracellular protein transport protein n=1 Tax=Arthrobotrys conoides TaxID=74498 RepID=A0AAN8NU36_9PEZI